MPITNNTLNLGPSINVHNEPYVANTRFLTIFILFIGLFTGLRTANAQLDNSPFYAKDTLVGQKNDLFLKLKSFAYNRNDEYVSRFANGETFFGYQINPEFEYYFTSDVALSFGIFANQDFGNPALTMVQPTYQLQINHNKNRFLFGNISGNVNHKYIEPLYNFRSLILRPRETGMQYLVNHKRWNADFWMDWQRNIYPGDDFLEQIYGGISGTYHLIDKPKDKVEIPFQYVIFHEGGQIDITDDYLKLKSNRAVGITWTHKIAADSVKSFINEFKLDNYIAFYQDHLNDTTYHFHNGNGIYLNASVRKKNHTIMVSYWQGNGYMGIRGGPNFNSESQSFKHAGRLDKNRKLLYLRLISNINIAQDVKLSLRLEPYYDFSRTWKQTFTDGILDFSNAIYINLEKRFYVKSLKEKN